MEGLTEINIGFTPGSQEWKEEAYRAVMALEHDGAISVYGHDVDDNLRKAMVETISPIFRASDFVQAKLVRPKKNYQSGLTPPDIEKHRKHKEWMNLPLGDRPLTNCAGKDLYKYRWFEPIGPEESYLCPPVETNIPGFRLRLMSWGKVLAYDIVKDRLARMIAFAYGLPVDYFDKILDDGVHLVAPTGTELGRLLPRLTLEKRDRKHLPFIKLAGFHNDLNWGTIHGRATLPGLWIWTTERKRMLVRIKQGHLLFQVGQQLAAQTAYRMKAGYHEVVITPELGKEIQQLTAGQTFSWRIGSTVFVTADRKAKLMPHDKLFEGLDREALIKAHPHLSMTVEEQMQAEFAEISFA